jgi:hypothetical protein
MKKQILLLALGAVALTAVPAANARLNVEVGINPFGYGYAPPVVYAPDPYYYDAPPAVYVGGGYWGGGDHGRRDGGDRGHHGGGHGGGRHR